MKQPFDAHQFFFHRTKVTEFEHRNAYNYFESPLSSLTVQRL